MMPDNKTSTYANYTWKNCPKKILKNSDFAVFQTRASGIQAGRYNQPSFELSCSQRVNSFVLRQSIETM